MSKSKNNGVDPDIMIERYGADTSRLFCLFASPPEKDLAWSDDGIDGSYRFLNRVYRAVIKYADDVKNIDFDNLDNIAMSEQASKLRSKIHKTIKKCTEDFIERYRFNTGIAMMMELVNEIYQFEPKTTDDYRVMKKALTMLVRCLFPVCPHIAEELHQELGYSGSLYEYEWPTYKEDLTKDETIEYVFQVNGKIRGKEHMPVGLDDDELKKLALENERVKLWIEGKQIVKVIVVPNKLVNIVIK
jgi:leucyl-tRNA synthetase